MTAPFSTSDRPIVRMMPKANARAIRHGFPWVYANEVVLDRRTRKIEAGQIATLQDADRNDLGCIAFNANSKIIGRVLDFDAQSLIDEAWLEAKLKRALAMREAIYDAPFYRLVHAEADGLPGVVIDRFGDLCVLQPNAAWAEVHLDMLVAALVRVTGVGTVMKNAAGRTRGLEGLDDVSGVLHGSAPEAAISVQMNGAIYKADVIGGQKTGLFLDQRGNHAFAASLSRQGGRVLDVFAHVGGFSLAALAAGAGSALAVDGSAPALALAEQGAAEMGVSDRFETRKGDAFEVMEQLAAEGQKFEVVICDPPAFAPAKPALEAGLRAYERVAKLAAGLVAEGGFLGLCSCSHAAELTKFRQASVRGIAKAGRTPVVIHSGQAGPDHPMLSQLAESGYLKSVFFRL